MHTQARGFVGVAVMPPKPPKSKTPKATAVKAAPVKKRPSSSPRPSPPKKSARTPKTDTRMTVLTREGMNKFMANCSQARPGPVTTVTSATSDDIAHIAPNVPEPLPASVPVPAASTSTWDVVTPTLTHTPHAAEPEIASMTPAATPTSTSDAVDPTQAPRADKPEVVSLTPAATSATSTTTSDIIHPTQALHADEPEVVSVTPAATFTTTPDVITPIHALHADEPEVADVMVATSPSQARLPASEPHVSEVSSSCETQVTSTHAPEAESSSLMPAAATSPSDSVAPWLRDRTEKLSKLRDTLFGWPQELLRKLAELSSDDEHEYAEYMLTVFNSMSMSTSFSGVDSPSTALAMMGAAALTLQGREVTKDSVPRTCNKFGIEWLSQSQQELSRHPYGSSCIFSDINDFWHPTLADKLDTISRERLVMAVLKDLVKPSVCTGRVAYCKKCNRNCRVSEADLHIVRRLQCTQTAMPVGRPDHDSVARVHCHEKGSARTIFYPRECGIVS